MTEQNQHLDALHDIKRMMQRSSRFISLSGLSGIAAGICALAGAWFANNWLQDYHRAYEQRGYSGAAFRDLEMNLILLAMAVAGLAFLSALYFTWRRAGRHKVPLWNHTSRQLLWNTAVPIIAGGFFLLIMLLQYNEWRLIGPGCLIFYGLALVNGSKYTVSDIRYLGYCEIILGLVSTQYPKHSLEFWTAGFGILHIIYGFLMWWKYERKTADVS